jgi:hypothetical protein
MSIDINSEPHKELLVLIVFIYCFDGTDTERITQVVRVAMEKIEAVAAAAAEEALNPTRTSILITLLFGSSHLKRTGVYFGCLQGDIAQV